MDRRLNLPRAMRSRGSRRLAFMTVIAVVCLLHVIVTRQVAAQLADFDAANAMPPRMQVAYVRTLELEAPKAAAPTPRPKVAPAAARPRQVHRVARAASAPEPVVAEASTPESAAASSADAAVAAASSPDAAVAAAAAASEAASAAAALAAASSASAASDAAALAAASASSGPASGIFVWPSATRVSYDVVGNYRGPIDGKADVEWIRVGERYQVNVDVFAGPQFAPIFSRHMMSEGTVADSGLAPDRYSEETQFLMRDKRHVSVTFAPDSVELANGQKQDRMPGVQDTASQFIQFTWLFGSKPEALRVGASFEFPLALPRSLKTWTYDVVGEDTLYTPLGPLPAFHLKPRIAERKPGELTVEMWFAPELRFLPVRIRIEQDAGTFVDLMISKKPEIAAS
jgi:hypothetical protein